MMMMKGWCESRSLILFVCPNLLLFSAFHYHPSALVACLMQLIDQYYVECLEKDEKNESYTDSEHETSLWHEISLWQSWALWINLRIP